MYNLLNRFAWILSLVSGFVIVFMLGIMVDGFDRGIDDDFFMILLFFSVVCGVVFKNIFLNKTVILEALKFFAKRLREDLEENFEFGILDSKLSDSVKSEGGGVKGIENGESRIENETVTSVLNDKKETIASTQTSAIAQDVVQHEYNEVGVRVGEGVGVEELIENETIASAQTSVIAPKEPNIIQKFFAENVMAKIGGILVFLAVLFFLKLIYAYIGDVTKLIIGFVFGFGLVGIGVFLEKKKLKNESMVLMGTGFLVNYLVILAGRYLLGGTTPLLGEASTFVFLILNTIFAVCTSLVYKSPTMLLFSFIFAYINPFLVGGTMETPYVVGGYGILVSLSGLFLSYSFRDNKGLSKVLTYISVFGSSLLLLMAPFNAVSGWIFKLVGIGIIGLTSLAVAYKTKNYEDIGGLLLINYISFAVLMFSGGTVLNDSFHGLAIYAVYMSYLLVFALATVFAFVLTGLASIITFMVVPVILLLLMIFTGNIVFVIPTLVMVTILGLLGFVSMFAKLTASFRYGFFVLLAIFITLVSMYVSFESIKLGIFETLGVYITSIIFMLAAYYFSSKKGLEYLYTLGTIATILMVLPLIQTSGEMMALSIMLIVLIGILNIGAPFANFTLLKSNIRNLSIGLVIGVIFLAGQLYQFGDIYFPGVTLGYAFLGLAALYFVVSFLMMKKLEVDIKEEKPEDSPARNVIYSILGASISLFTLAIALVFSSYAEIISVVWLLEATLLFFFYARVKDEKVHAAAIILIFIGIGSLFRLINDIVAGDISIFIPMTIVLISLVGNIYFLQGVEDRTKGVHDILHLLGMLAINAIIMKVIGIWGHHWSLFGFSILLVLMGFVYHYFNARLLKNIFYFIFGLFMFYHVMELKTVLNGDIVSSYNLSQYFTTALLALVPAYGYISQKEKTFGMIFASYVFYLFIVSTIFVYDLISDTFVITMYWGILTAGLLFYGISQDKLKYRTIGLYILCLTVGKIIFIDIWYGLDEPILRVLALMGIGILMIVISAAYNKKYDGKMKEEFSLGNLFEKN